MRKLLLILLVLTLAAAGWLWWSPRNTAERIQAAAAAEDTVALQELVDFPTLRADLKDGFDRALEARMSRAPNEIERTVLGGVTGALADRLGSPRGVVQMVRNGSAFLPLGGATISTRLQREDLNTYTMVLIRSDTPRDSMLFALERKGPKWQMTAVYFTEVLR